MGVEATVVIPTTGDRGPLLPYSVGSALRQTVRDLEIFIMGDGVSEATRKVIRELMEQDHRVRFFDHPKHARRGEPHRHEALQSARGTIVCYLCDRDLWLPHHLETQLKLLSHADFAHTTHVLIRPNGSRGYGAARDLNRAAHKRAFLANRVGIVFSSAGHTLEHYRRLPRGWQTTPEGIATDWYMFQQIIQYADCRVSPSDVPTVLYFKRGGHPGWPTERRRPELEQWHRKLLDPGWCKQFVASVDRDLGRWDVRMMRALFAFHAVHPRLGRPLRQPWRFWKRLRRLDRI